MHLRSGRRGFLVYVASGTMAVTTALVLTSCSLVLPAFEASIECSRTSSATLQFAAVTNRTPTDVAWDFGDLATSAEASPAHTYAARGTYTINLDVVDISGRQASAHATVTVGHDWRVPQDGALQKAINSAWDGDTVFVGAGGGPLLIEKDLEILAVTPCELSLVQYRGVGGVLRGFSVTGAPGKKTSALVLEDATPLIQDCLFSDGDAVYGGAVLAQDSAARFERCEFVGNRADLGGGAVYARGTHAFPSFSNCTFQDGRAGQAGAALCFVRYEGGDEALGVVSRGASPAEPVVQDCVFSDNEALQGGAVLTYDCAARFERCQFIGNESDEGGGAVCATGTRAFPSFFDCLFTSNRAGDAGGALLERLAGGLLASDAKCTHVEECSFTSNVGRQNPTASFAAVGGAIHVGTGCRVVLRANTFTANRPGDIIYEDLTL